MAHLPNGDGPLSRQFVVQTSKRSSTSFSRPQKLLQEKAMSKKTTPPETLDPSHYAGPQY